MKKHAVIILTIVCLTGCATHSGGLTTSIKYSGEEGSLQQVIDAAPLGATVVCDTRKQLELSSPLTIKKTIALKGLNARLPKKLGRTSLIVVNAEGVTLSDIELHGNYDSVDQKDRAPLIKIHMGNFRLERCKFYDSSKDGVAVYPENEGDDIVGGTIRDIEAFRIGRDAVSISGGNRGLRVRDVTVENISLKKGYLRGAVEVSDGTDNITVRNVYAEKCPYAVDVQDHGKGSAANTNVYIENVEAVRCRHIIRTANWDLGHANLTLRNITGKRCQEPVRISNTKNVTIENLRILDHQSKEAPISLRNCQGVNLKNVTIESIHSINQPVRMAGCKDVKLTGVTKTKLSLTD